MNSPGNILQVRAAPAARRRAVTFRNEIRPPCRVARQFCDAACETAGAAAASPWRNPEVFGGVASSRDRRSGLAEPRYASDALESAAPTAEPVLAKWRASRPIKASITGRPSASTT